MYRSVQKCSTAGQWSLGDPRIFNEQAAHQCFENAHASWQLSASPEDTDVGEELKPVTGSLPVGEREIKLSGSVG